jgi:tetraacyldisaccharide 4'-kinase
MHPPAFWRYGGGRLLPALLWPASQLVTAATARRVARAGWHAPVPVICCGNAGVGGAGKTTLALDLAQRLCAMGRQPHVLSRGHGGSARGPLRVDPSAHTAALVGDEPLLLAQVAPCWVGADRAATARLAVQAGAGALIMDDGLQNPTLHKDCALLVIDGAAGFGNGRVLPAGPLREPVGSAASRCQAAVLIGTDDAGACGDLPPGLAVLRADLVPGAGIAALRDRRVVAFAGIGRPEKFFSMLARAGVEVAARAAFPDHHPFSPGELARLRADAVRQNATLVTTPKDFARIPLAARDAILPVGVELAWEDEAALKRMLAGLWRR